MQRQIFLGGLDLSQWTLKRELRPPWKKIWSLRYPDGPEEASSLTVNFPWRMDLWTWRELECCLWELRMAPSRQLARNQGPQTQSCNCTTWGGLETDSSPVDSPDKNAAGCHLDYTLMRPWTESPAKAMPESPGHRNCEIISFCHFTLLSLWYFIMQQQELIHSVLNTTRWE